MTDNALESLGGRRSQSHSLFSRLLDAADRQLFVDYHAINKRERLSNGFQLANEDP
jgi:hypothetical protein